VPENSMLSVTALTRKIRTLLELELGELWVEGEVSNHTAAASGHHYFTLKDDNAQLSCVMFKGNAMKQRAQLKEGMALQAFGELSVYEARGNYQLIVRQIEEAGAGQLQAQFEELKRKLNLEGLFDEERKQEIPEYPQCLGVVTSPTGAAIQDILDVTGRRAPWVRVLLYPTRVQGEGAEHEIAAGIEYLNSISDTGKYPKIDTVIVGRGGGSIEDLWNFNEEVVARAIAASEIPIISAVGHEIDFTIADFVADLRAPTPSAAAEIAVPEQEELHAYFAGIEESMRRRVLDKLNQYAMRLDHASRADLFRNPLQIVLTQEKELNWCAESLRSAINERFFELREELRDCEQRLGRHRPIAVLDSRKERLVTLHDRLKIALQGQLERREEMIYSQQKVLNSLGPKSVLKRGYSMTLNQKGAALTSVAKVKKGQSIRTLLYDGELESIVDAVKKN